VCVLGVDLNIKLGQIRPNLIFKSTHFLFHDAEFRPVAPRRFTAGRRVVNAQPSAHNTAANTQPNLAMLLALALALRAPPRISHPLMCAEPVGNEQSVDVEVAAVHTRAKLGPTPDLTPAEVLETMLAAFQRGGDDDVEDLFQFVVPDGDLYTRHASSAGAMACFRWKIRKEPRWQKVYDRPCAMLLGMRSFEVVGSVMTDADIMLCGVRASPFFPDAPHAEAEAFFEFQLVRRSA
jgi:hypothetical protein